MLSSVFLSLERSRTIWCSKEIFAGLTLCFAGSADIAEGWREAISFRYSGRL